MKTKFSQILQIKKRDVEEIENILIQKRVKKRELEYDIDEILEKIKNQDSPKEGNFAQLKLSYVYFNKLVEQKKSKELKLSKIVLDIHDLKERYKMANVEYEKVKYLENEEIKLQKLRRLKQESKDMDEIANLLFSRKKQIHKV